MLPYYWLPRPSISINEAKCADVLAHPVNGWLEPSGIPKWQFLCWLADQKGYLLHGSGDSRIDIFEPRQSNDIDDFGNRKAVYAASDGIWPMFYAVVDRSRYTMTINNAAIRIELPNEKLSEPYYFFSVTDKALQQKPFREGVVYVLPREGFESQAPFRRGEWVIHQHQWANLQAVTPIAKISVTPQDFPFLQHIRGQDDEVLAERIEKNPHGFPWIEDTYSELQND
jgi:hypothetical protein